MNVQDIMLILGGIGALLASLGGAARWILSYIDTKAKEALDNEKKARDELKAYMDREIRELNDQLRLVTSREALYLKRILQLEAYILGQKGLALPVMEGWPPK